MSGGFATPERGFWGLPLTADDRWPVDACEPNVRQQLYAEIDSLVAQGIARDAAIRWVEDRMHMKRGALVAFLER